MSSTPFMQVYVADYTADTQHLSCEEDGAYWRLLRAMWRAGGSLPADDRKLAIICGLTPTAWKRVKVSVITLFDVGDVRITQKRLAKELEKARGKSEKRSHAGKMGAAANALKNNEPGSAIAAALPQHSLEPEPEIEEMSPNGDSSLSGDFDLVPAKPDPVVEAFDCYNRMAKAHGLTVARKLDQKRRIAIRARLKEVGLPEWVRAVERVPLTPFLMGENDRGWTVDLDFLTQAKKLQRVLEGSYEGSRNGRSTAPTNRAERERDAMVEGARQAAAGRGVGRRWAV